MIEIEINRRKELWKKIKSFNDGDITPTQLRDLRVYGGSQGIYTDKLNTANYTSNGKGLTVSILHLGDYYPDELDENGILYHYPQTQRPSSRDEGEVIATKNTVTPTQIPTVTVIVIGIIQNPQQGGIKVRTKPH